MGCSSETSRPFWIACLEARIDIGEFLQIVSAQRSAAASASPCGTTSLTKPSSCPSLAETWRAVRIMPIQPDLPWQPVHAAGQRCKADTRLRQCEGGILRGDDEGAGQRDLEPTAHRNAVDGGDDRLVAVEARGQAGKSALVPARFAARGPPLQIVAGAEPPVAGA